MSHHGHWCEVVGVPAIACCDSFSAKFKIKIIINQNIYYTDLIIDHNLLLVSSDASNDCDVFSNVSLGTTY